MATGTRRALPLASNSMTLMARGPLEACWRRVVYWAKAAVAVTMTMASSATARRRRSIMFERRDHMEVNNQAPDFTLPDENGTNVSLHDFRGKNVVLFFFPKANTPG